MSGSLSGKTAFVTGGSRGIGRAIVRTLAVQGARVAFTYRSQRDEALSLQREFPDVVRAFEMEAASRPSIEAAMSMVAGTARSMGVTVEE